MALFQKLVKAFKDAEKAVTDFTMKTANSIMEGITAGNWQGKDVYNGFGANPAPTENTMMQESKEELKEEGTNAPAIPTTNPNTETSAEGSSGTSAEGSSGTSGGIVDKTDENLEIPLYYGENNVFNWIEEQQKRLWEREDAIRKETQLREDTAFSRSIRDLQKAGANINLLGNITPAESGGGITTATGKTYEVYEQEMNKYLQELEMLFDKTFQGNENDKDRVVELLKGVMTLFGGITIANAKK